MRTLACTCLLMLTGSLGVLAAEPEHMTWGHRTVDSRVVPKTIAVDQTNTLWRKGRACKGKGARQASKLARLLEKALRKEGTLKVLARSKKGKKAGADWLLKVDLTCQPDRADLKVVASEAATGTVVWTKTHQLLDARKGAETIALIVRGMIDFAKEGISKAEPAKEGERNMALLPLRDKSGKFTAEQLSKIHKHLSVSLGTRGYKVLPQDKVSALATKKKGDYRDEAYVVELAEELGASVGLSAWLQAEGKQCTFSFLMVPVAGDGEDKSAAVQVDCSVLDLKEGIGQLVEQI